MEKLILEIKNLIKNYPEYNDVVLDENKNIIIKKNIIKKDKNRDTITEIVRRLIKEDMK